MKLVRAQRKQVFYMLFAAIWAIAMVSCWGGYSHSLNAVTTVTGAAGAGGAGGLPYDSHRTFGLFEYLHVIERDVTFAGAPGANYSRSIVWDTEQLVWTVLLTIGITLLVCAMAPKLVSKYRLRKHCDECGYLIAGLTGAICPECGHAIKAVATPENGPPPCDESLMPDETRCT